MTSEEARALVREMERRQADRLSAVDVELWVEQLVPHEHRVGRLAVAFTCCIYRAIPTLPEFVALLDREAALWPSTRQVPAPEPPADADTTRAGLAAARAALRGTGGR